MGATDIRATVDANVETGEDHTHLPLLVPIAVAFAVGIATAIAQPEISSVSWSVAALGASAAALCAALAGHSRLAGVALLTATATLGATRLATAVHELPADHLGRLAWIDDEPLLVALEAVAIDRPRLIPRRGALARFDHRPPRWRFRARAVAIGGHGDGASQRASGTVWMSLDGSPPVDVGDRFVATGWLRGPPKPLNPGQRDARRWAQLDGVVGTMTAGAGNVRRVGAEPGVSASFSRLRAAARGHGLAVLHHALPRDLCDEPRGLIRAMLLGERHEGLDGLEPAFRRTGLAHLLAISGFHLAVLAGAAAAIARGRHGSPSRGRRAAVAVVAATLPYMLLVEAQPSVLRAGTMLLLASAAAMAGRGWSSGGTLALALLAILIAWPGDIAKPGLQLSFAVVAGLVWLGPRLRARWSVPRDRDASTLFGFARERLREAGSAAVAAWLVSTPIVLHHFGMLSPLAAPLTMIAMPVAAALLVCGHATLAFTPLLGAAASLPGALLVIMADALIAIVRAADALPGVVVHRPPPGTAWTVLTLAAVCALGVAPRASPQPAARPRRPWPEPWERAALTLRRWAQRGEDPLRRFGIPIAVAALLAWGVRPPAPLPETVALRIDALAVGDGTCILLRHGGRAMLYDVGSADLSIGGRTIVPALRALGVSRLDMVIISHADADHYSGLPEVVDAFDVGRIVVTAELLERIHARPGPLRSAFSAATARAIPLELAAAGDLRTWGPMTMRWLHPPHELRRERTNDLSQVILMETAGRSLLLCGDIEDEAVAMVRERDPELRADVLELPHHGSWRRPATELVVAVAPEVIIQSTGVRRLQQDRWTALLAERLPSTRRIATARDGAAWVEIGHDGSVLAGCWIAAAEQPQRATAGSTHARAATPILSVMLLSESYVHTLDPVLLPIAGSFAVRWYGLAYVSGFLIGWLLLRWMSATRRSALDPGQLADLVTFIIIGVLVGGRLGHALLYEPAMLWTFDGAPPFWQLLAIHKGGMASHGGIVGVIVACCWFARRHRLPAWHIVDLAAFAAPAGLSLGRVANLINGELWGRPLPASMWASPPWWSIKYPSEILDPNFPNADRLGALAHLVDPQRPLPHGLVDAAYLGRTEVIERLAPLLTPHWPSQAFQAITDGPLLMALLVAVWWRPRRPGVVAAWFIAGYGAMRLLTEQFREPDVGVLRIGPLTLPMALSLLMILVGLALVRLNARRDTPPVGGLGPARIPFVRP